MSILTKRRNTKTSGFTLIELLVVIAIIALLATAVLTAMMPARQSGRDARRLKEMHSVETALEAYYNDHNSYPNHSDTPLSTLVTDLTGGTNDYLPRMPEDPLNSGAYVYRYGTTDPINGYALKIKLERSGGSEHECIFKVGKGNTVWANTKLCGKK